MAEIDAKPINGRDRPGAWPRGHTMFDCKSRSRGGGFGGIVRRLGQLALLPEVEGLYDRWASVLPVSERRRRWLCELGRGLTSEEGSKQASVSWARTVSVG
ncbi:hypothetical protein E2562_017642 [Oryza meyeriana var. granulata]|uniref:Uncharacterized protein n=1 Tax=Oryza meyeriana var. granulata TaxID=110450 RepID=A0A6G1BYD0_9ORYZ|nr:hypothetical protein E2562_017642 [Oryza meyeriana var. granulata]